MFRCVELRLKIKVMTVGGDKQKHVWRLRYLNVYKIIQHVVSYHMISYDINHYSKHVTLRSQKQVDRNICFCAVEISIMMQYYYYDTLKLV